MANLQKVEKVVEKVLKAVPATRHDDFILLLYVYHEINPTTSRTNFKYLMEQHKEFRLPSFESVTRTRRKLQRENAELRSGSSARRRRSEEEEKFREYAMKRRDWPF